jgi:rubredoxin
MIESFLSPPRWQNGPQICTFENLPAFESKDLVKKYQATECPMCSIIETWQCAKCGLFHFTSAPPPVSGGSSGNSRTFADPKPKYKTL